MGQAPPSDLAEGATKAGAYQYGSATIATRRARTGAANVWQRYEYDSGVVITRGVVGQVLLNS